MEVLYTGGMEVSVVVPARNERERIGQLLESLLKQTRKPLEIVVVDNGSNDGTAEVVEGFGQQFKTKGVRLRLIDELIMGVARARNSGVRVARGEIIASTDADCMVAKDWIEKISEYFERHSDVGVIGELIFQDAPGLLKFLRKRFYSWWYFRALTLFFGFQTLNTANSAWLKDGFEKVGGFDEKIIDPDGLDDVELASRLSRIGKIGNNDKIKVFGSFRRYLGLNGIKVVGKRIIRILEIAYEHRSGFAVAF